MLRRDPTLARWFEPLGSLLWIWFLVWTALVAVLWTTGIGEVEIGSWKIPSGLRATLPFLCNIADGAWFALAAANIHLCVAATHGLATARRRALIVIGCAALLIACSVWTGFPLGPVRFGSRLGVNVGPVPPALPLYWFAVILGARELLLRVFRRAGHAQIALGAGVLALLTDWNLEPLATRLRGLWFWNSPATHLPVPPPVQNYVTWLLAAAALAFALRDPVLLSKSRGSSDRPIVIFILFNLVFLAAHVAVRLRG